MKSRTGAIATWTFVAVTIAGAGASLAADVTLTAPQPVEGATPIGFGAGTAFAAGLAMLAAGWGVRVLKGRAPAA